MVNKNKNSGKLTVEEAVKRIGGNGLDYGPRKRIKTMEKRKKPTKKGIADIPVVKIPQAKKDSATLVVLRVDNRAVFQINGGKIFDETRDGDPKLHLPVGLGSYLNLGDNLLTIQLWNNPNPAAPNQNPWHIAYQILVDGVSVFDFDLPKNDNTVGLVFADTINLQVV